MTDQDFCKIDTEFYGEEVDHIKQISLRSFTGEELKEYVEAAINYTRCSTQLLCVNDDDCVRLTKGNKYEIEAESDSSYTVFDDFGIINLFNKNRFNKTK